MRVFITGTGRCGTTTFAMACKHFSKYTSEHESTNGFLSELDFPKNHIESEPGLVWRLPQLIKKYPNDLYVHLYREKESCVEDIATRSSQEIYAKLTERVLPGRYDKKQLASNYYDFVTSTVDLYFMESKITSLKMKLVPTLEKWKEFCSYLDVTEDEVERSYDEWKIKHNQ